MSREAAGHEGANGGSSKKRTRWLYARVLIVQAIALIALYILQAVYGS